MVLYISFYVICGTCNSYILGAHIYVGPYLFRKGKIIYKCCIHTYMKYDMDVLFPRILLIFVPVVGK